MFWNLFDYFSFFFIFLRNRMFEFLKLFFENNINGYFVVINIIIIIATIVIIIIFINNSCLYKTKITLKTK